MKVCVHGAYGEGNRGQDIILAQLLGLLAEELPGARVTLLCEDPERLALLLDREHRRLPLDLRPLDASFRRRFAAVTRAVLGADLFVLCGGGLLHGGVPGNLANWLRRPRLALLAGRRLVLYSPGIFDIRGRSAHHLLGAVARRASFISVREPHGFEVLEACGIPAERILMGADPSFLLPPPEPADVERLRSALDLTGQSLVGISARDWRRRLSAGFLAGTVAKLLEDGSRTLLFFAMRSGGRLGEPEGGDLSVARSLLRTLPADQRRRFVLVDDSYREDEVLALMTACDYLLGMRLHALIYATIAGTPFGAIVCEEKVHDYMDMLGRQDRALPLRELGEPGRLEALIESLAAERLAAGPGPVTPILMAGAGLAARSRSVQRDLAEKLREWYPSAKEGGQA